MGQNPAGVGLLRGLLSPQVSVRNFRPVGAFYYQVLGGYFGLDFPKFIAAIHALHLLNIWLFWLLARRLGLSPLAASAGAFFFGFHAALFDAWWKPMFVFDVLCATFSLLTLLSYAYNRWILSLVSFWLAYKSKELAVMLPAVLGCYELWFGKRQWKRLLPFFAISLLFGLQALFNPPLARRYALRTDRGTGGAGENSRVLCVKSLPATVRGSADTPVAVSLS